MRARQLAILSASDYLTNGFFRQVPLFKVLKADIDILEIARSNHSHKVRVVHEDIDIGYRGREVLCGCID